MKQKILSIGTMYLDINCHSFPYGQGLLPEQEVVGRDYEIVPGRSALNFARFCASLEFSPIFIGKAGVDKAGALLEELVLETGIIPAFIKSNNVATNLGMNFVGENGKSIMTVVGTANQSLNGQEVENKVYEYLNNVEYLYLGGCFKLKSLLPHFLGLAKKAKKQGVKIVLDHGRTNNDISKKDIQIVHELIEFVDYYLPSKDEFLSVWNENSIENAAKKVQKNSSTTIVVKDAENGAIGFNKEEKVYVPSFPVRVQNTVGAGDSFNAGFIKAQDLGFDFEKSIRFACATAAVKISQTNLPTMREVEAVLKRT